jgi:hypothetical protein
MHLLLAAWRPVAVAALASLLTACGCWKAGVGRPEAERVPHSPPPPEIVAEDDKAETHSVMRDVWFHSAPNVVLRIHRLEGPMLRADPDRPPFFDDGKSFRLRLDSAEIGMSTTDLEHLLEEHVFAYEGAPMRDIEVCAQADGLCLRATLLRPVHVRIEIAAGLDVRDGDVVLVTRAVKVLKTPVGGLMKAFKIELGKVVDLSGANGVRAEGNDLVLDPEAVLPSPAIEGRVTAARVQGDEVVLTFGEARAPSPPPRMPVPDATSYMHFKGGTMRFGRLYMIRADMQILDADQADPFDFDLARYEEQLIAGYSRNQPGGGMLVVMPDLDDLDRKPVPLPAVPGGARPAR